MSNLFQIQNQLNEDQPGNASPFIWMGGLFCLMCVMVCSMLLGAKSIPLSEIINLLIHPSITTENQLILMEGRFPRTIAGLFCGIALGLSGVIIQAITRNPLADPGILGLNAGASFAIVLAVSVFGLNSPVYDVLFAFGGAAFTGILVFLLGTLGNPHRHPVRYILSGVAISAVLIGLSSAMTLINPAVFDKLRFWSAGSLDIRTTEPLLWMGLLLLPGILLALRLAAPLNAIQLGEQMATALGIQSPKVLILALLTITLLVSCATAFTGPIGFIGLMVPHVARWIVGQHQLRIMLFTLLFAPILLISTDIIGRFLLTNELRVSVVTAFIGAPMMIWLVRRQTRL